MIGTALRHGFQDKADAIGQREQLEELVVSSIRQMRAELARIAHVLFLLGRLVGLLRAEETQKAEKATPKAQERLRQLLAEYGLEDLEHLNKSRQSVGRRIDRPASWSWVPRPPERRKAKVKARTT